MLVLVVDKEVFLAMVVSSPKGFSIVSEKESKGGEWLPKAKKKTDLRRVGGD